MLGAVQVQNGEGDTLSQSSSILQDNWEAVLALATDTSAAGGSAPGSAGGVGPGTLVRHRVVELMETVLRRALEWMERGRRACVCMFGRGAWHT